jgi:hypothetical protein
VVLPAPPVCCAQAPEPISNADAKAAPVKIVFVRIGFLRLGSST